ncbi:MAG: hypothetical protein M3P18_08240 [Actinomycetota bacterium]|nr:hypothetical protein [Actinomycetota bacterium]
MSRAWPFEDKPQEAEPIRAPEQFVDRSGEGTEAVVVRIGLHDAQLILVDRSGAWQRWVYPSVEAAEGVANGLGVTVHTGEYPEATRVRINGLQRAARDFDRAAYPEQGEVGPVIGYPENRPRQTGSSAGEARSKRE